MYYEEEIRIIISNISPIVHSSIVFPSIDGQFCTLLLDLMPSSAYSADLIHDGLSTPVLHSICNKSHFNPIFIGGHAFTISPTNLSRQKAVDIDVQNKAVFTNLAKILSRDGLMLVLKVSCLDDKYFQYWVITPPSYAPNEGDDDHTSSDCRYNTMILMKLVDKDSLLRCNDKESIEETKSGNDNDEIMEYLQQSLQGMACQQYNPRSAYSGLVNHKMTTVATKSNTNTAIDNDYNTDNTYAYANTNTNKTNTKIPVKKPSTVLSETSRSSSTVSSSSSSSSRLGQLPITKTTSPSSSTTVPLRERTPPQPQVFLINNYNHYFSF